MLNLTSWNTWKVASGDKLTNIDEQIRDLVTGLFLKVIPSFWL